MYVCIYVHNLLTFNFVDDKHMVSKLSTLNWTTNKCSCLGEDNSHFPGTHQLFIVLCLGLAL